MTTRAKAQFDKQRDFTIQERKKLEEGKLIVRPITQRKGELKLMGGMSWQLINAPSSVVWKALLDTQYYHRFMPQVLEARLVKQEQSKRILFIKHGSSLINVYYHLVLKSHTKQGDITFCVDPNRPRSLKAGWGFYTIHPRGKHRTVLAFGILADIGDNILLKVARGSVQTWMLRVPWMVKRFVEGSGKWIYNYRPMEE